MSAVPDQPLPRGVHRRDLEVRGGPLAVLDAVPADPTGTVVLVPGFTGSKEDFVFLLEPLAAAGLRAVAVDQRGQHDSPGPPDPAAYSVAALAADLLALVDALDAGPVHLVGHSFGGLVSRAAVLDDPDSFRSLVLMGSGPAALSGPRADTLPFMKAILEEGGLHAVWEASQALPSAKPQPPEVLAFLKKRFLAHEPAALHGMGDALVSEPDRVDELGTVDLPLLVVYGEADDAWLPHLQDDMARRLGAGVVVVPGSVHSPAAENPTFTAETLIRFFQGQ
jgi:pimeloyl-ACP methyl ester carboxylesterase